MPFDYIPAIRAVARNEKAAQKAIDGMDRCKEWLDQRGVFTRLRLAHLIGQCAHESWGFSRRTESLSYSAKRLVEVWPSRFPTLAAAAPFARNQKALANNVYGGRMGNTEPNDGWRFRGRGWLQLTGRSNYRTFGGLIGVDLEASPGRASEPEVAWRIAAVYLATRKRQGRTAFEWADRGDVEQITRIINGGTHGLADRRALIERALEALAPATV